MQHSHRLDRASLLLALVALAAGCSDPSEPATPDAGPTLLDLDPSTLPSYPASTWIRSEGAGATAVTELLVVESDSPATWSDGIRRISRARVGYDGSVEILLGAMEPGAVTGAGEIVFGSGHFFTPEPGVAIASRMGAYLQDLAPVATNPLQFTMNAEELEVTIGSDTRSYSNFIRLVESLGTTPGYGTQAGAESLAQLTMLSIVTGQARILGFGGPGMGQYLSTPTTFPSIVQDDAAACELTVEVTDPLMPQTSVTFSGFMDHHATLLDGTMTSTVNAAGDGTMVGTVMALLRMDVTTPVLVVTCMVDFGNVLYTGGYLSGGSAQVVCDGLPYTVDASFLEHIDLSSYLPVP